jgi:hypothetical protein
LRPDRPLDYGRLSEPIVIRRAKDGDREALADVFVHANISLLRRGADNRFRDLLDQPVHGRR